MSTFDKCVERNKRIMDLRVEALGRVDSRSPLWVECPVDISI